MEKETKPLRILLADDHDVVRRGLRAVLEIRKDWKICAEASDGRTAAELAAELKPDVAILDVSMPSLNGLDATQLIRKGSPGTEVLIFTMYENERLIRDVLESGAKGYLLKSDAGHSVIAAVEALAEHQPYFNWKVNSTIVEGFLRGTGSAAAEMPSREALTVREREVVQLLSEGLNNKNIATRLGLSIKTVETHRAAVMRKLDIHSVVDLVRYAIRNKLTSI